MDALDASQWDLSGGDSFAPCRGSKGPNKGKVAAATDERPGGIWLIGDCVGTTTATHYDMQRENLV